MASIAQSVHVELRNAPDCRRANSFAAGATKVGKCLFALWHCGDSTGIGSGDASNDGNWSRGHEMSVCMVLKSKGVCCCVPCERCVVMGTMCAMIVVEFVVEFVV